MLFARNENSYHRLINGVTVMAAFRFLIFQTQTLRFVVVRLGETKVAADEAVRSIRLR